MHVVFGANGRVGGEVARALVERDEPVRVVLRNWRQTARWEQMGVQVAAASVDDADAVAAAMEGATSAFLFNPPPVASDPWAQTEEIGTALAEGARRAGLPKAVVLSSIGAQHASGTGIIATLHRLERLLAEATPATTFLRPAYFIDTWSEVAEAAVSEGSLPTFLEPSLRIPMVSTTDVGRTAASLLCETWRGTRVLELVGPEGASAGDVAAAFAEALGQAVKPAFIPPHQRTAMLVSAGVPAEVAAALVEMYEGIAAGRVTHEPNIEVLRGTVSLTAAVRRIVAATQAGADRNHRTDDVPIVAPTKTTV